MTVPKAKRKTDPCPCGSEKQYRYCHGAANEGVDEGPEVQRNPRQLFLWLVIVGAPLAYIAGMTQPSPQSTAQQRVWSEEHGHYHTVDGKELNAQPDPAPAVDVPVDGAAAEPAAVPTKPPGPTPPGKVWSAEHGHWHDAPGTAAATDPPLTNPADGMPWDHDYQLDQPDGPAPEGMTWSAAHGHWHPNE